MLGQYHVEATYWALTSLQADPAAATLVAHLAESPDNVMVRPTIDVFDVSGSGIDWTPRSPRPLRPAQERALIRVLLATTFQYRIERIRQICPINTYPYEMLLFGLHGDRCCKWLLEQIRVRLRHSMPPFMVARMLGDYSHFLIDSVTPVHQYGWTRYLAQPDTLRGELVQMVMTEFDQHGPYETATYKNRRQEPRFEQDIGLLGEHFRVLQQQDQVREVLSQPPGFMQWRAVRR